MEVILFFLFIVACSKSLELYGHRMKKHHYYTSMCQPPRVEDDDIVFTGGELAFSNEEIHDILFKWFPYYKDLDVALKTKFIQRILIFMQHKTFIIKDKEGYREMPVLVSAAAIQLTFGLKKYRLPFYRYIRIYPAEYWSEKEFFKVLVGNVQENVISVSWKHVLEGYGNPSDGSNTPLHEMAHALYIQKMVIDEHYAKSFHLQYHKLLNECKEAHALEGKKQMDLYSEYAETNLQEFWAETAELFFERANELSAHYPRLFQAMTFLLNQNSMKKNSPVLNTKLGLKERFRSIELLFSTDPAYRSTGYVE